ncbi:transposase [Chitinophaga sp. CF118]|uniref:transposase n=1 Tax=Chitinophaga sp. CF118 TaxID=1884367 RepID=UPI003511263A
MKEKPYSVDKLECGHNKDVYYCPVGNRMKNIGSYTSTTKVGFKQVNSLYQARKCKSCLLRRECYQGEEIIIKVNHNLNRLKPKADKHLKSKQEYRNENNATLIRNLCLPILNTIKTLNDLCFFRGLEKVSIEMGLLALHVT